MRRPRTLHVVILLLALAGAAFAFRGVIRDEIASRTKPALPIAEPYHPSPVETATASAVAPTPGKPAAAKGPDVKPSVKTPSAPSEGVNLAVPFTSQAPHADWAMPYQEACEEASLVMVDAYYRGAGKFSPDEADRRILETVAWEKEHLGFYEDTNAEEVAGIGREYFGYGKTRAVEIRSMDDVKKELDRGVPVLLPAAGRLLRNPYFSGQGPLYHMLVVKGYTRDGKIITDDPGTRHGADYLYDPSVLWNAVHDWNGGDVEHGRKVMVLVEK